jgi:hypothetical protein
MWDEYVQVPVFGWQAVKAQFISCFACGIATSRKDLTIGTDSRGEDLSRSQEKKNQLAVPFFWYFE